MSMLYDYHERRDCLMDEVKDEAIEKVKKVLKCSTDRAELIADCIAYDYYDRGESGQKLVDLMDLSESEVLAILKKEQEFIKAYDKEVNSRMMALYDCIYD